MSNLNSGSGKATREDKHAKKNKDMRKDEKKNMDKKIEKLGLKIGKKEARKNGKESGGRAKLNTIIRCGRDFKYVKLVPTEDLEDVKPPPEEPATKKPKMRKPITVKTPETKFRITGLEVVPPHPPVNRAGIKKINQSDDKPKAQHGIKESSSFMDDLINASQPRQPVIKKRKKPVSNAARFEPATPQLMLTPPYSPPANPPKSQKKSVRFNLDVQVRYYEPDEIEIVEEYQRKKFEKLENQKLSRETPVFGSVKKDKMMESIPYSFPRKITHPTDVVDYGCNSQEKLLQGINLPEPIIIPLEDESNPGAVLDYTKIDPLNSSVILPSVLSDLISSIPGGLTPPPEEEPEEFSGNMDQFHMVIDYLYSFGMNNEDIMNEPMDHGTNPSVP